MTAALFSKWITEWDRELGAQKEKILPLADNCSSYLNLPELENIKFIMLPPNTTSVLQPLDQGVIHTLEAHFCKNMCQQILRHIALLRDGENCHKIANKLTLLDCLTMSKGAWKNVMPQMIKNCWTRGGFGGSNSSGGDGAADSAGDSFRVGAGVGDGDDDLVLEEAEIPEGIDIKDWENWVTLEDDMNKPEISFKQDRAKKESDGEEEVLDPLCSQDVNKAYMVLKQAILTQEKPHYDLLN